MELEHENRTLPLSRNGKLSAQVVDVDHEEIEESKNQGINFRFLLKVVRRNLLLVAGITAAVSSATLYSVMQTPRSYEGNFSILVEPITSEARLTNPTAISRDGGTNDGGLDYPTMLQMLQSQSLLSDIAASIRTRYPDVSYDSLRRGLVVQRIGSNMLDITKLIEVRYTGEDPQKVQFILGELARGFLRYSLQDRKTNINSGVQFIDEQLPRLQRQVNTLQSEILSLLQQNNLSDPASDRSETARQLRDVQVRRRETLAQLQEQRKLYDNLQRQLELAPNDLMAASTLSEDPNFRELIAELKRVERQIATESTRFTDESPMMQSLRDRQKELRQLVNQEAQRITQRSVVNPNLMNFQNSTRQGLIRQLVEVTNTSQVLEVRNQALARAETQLKQQVQQFSAIVRRYNDLQSRLEIASRALNQLLAQRQTLQVEAAQRQVPWKIVSQPGLPRDAAGNPIPLARKAGRTLGMGVLGGLGLGLAAAFLREKYRKVFYTTEDLRDAALEFPVLEITSISKRTSSLPTAQVEPVGLLVGSKITSANTYEFTQTFSSLQSSMRFLLTGPSIHALVVSSAEAGDGKTTVALNLARAATLMGRRVLLVDANLYQPQIHQRLGLTNSRGLSNLLSESVQLSHCIQQSPVEKNLFILTAGQFRPSYPGLLGSSRMQDLMVQFQAAFDLVIYDTPDLLTFIDANLLAGRTDGVLMVVKVGKTSRTAVTEVISQLEAYHLPVLGIVANQVKKHPSIAKAAHRPYQTPQAASSTPNCSPRSFLPNPLKTEERPQQPLDS